MKKYTVWFEIFGKKMKTEIEANDESEARSRIRSKIIFHKTIESKTPSPLDEDEWVKKFTDILTGGKK